MLIYDEDLSYDNFDKRKFDNVRRYVTYIWYVLKKSVGELCKPNSINQLIFDQVHLISISHSGYTLCSCGGVQRYLIPCRYVCVVLAKKIIL